MKPTDFETMRVQELLMLQATEGLSDLEQSELRRFDADKSDIFDSVAAMVELSVDHTEAMPQDVADRILQTALAAGARRYTDTSTAPAVPAVAAVLTSRHVPTVTALVTANEPTFRDIQPTHAPSKRVGSIAKKSWPQGIFIYAGWASAAAAAAVAWWVTSNSAKVQPPPAPRAASAALVENAKTTVTRSWANSADPAITGTVRWNAELQQGVLEITALHRNVTHQQRYQLWIFDGEREEKFPVDAGLFDVVAERTSLVFSPHVKVKNATQFMITLEDAQGAVVSNRAHIAAVTVP